MRITLHLLLLAFLTSLPLAAQETLSDDPNVTFWFRVRPPITEAQYGILASEFDLGPSHGDPRNDAEPFDVFVPGAQLALFRSLGLKSFLVERSHPASSGSSGNEDAPPSEYFTTSEIVAEIDAQVTANPAIAQKVDLATIPGGVKTHNGQSIWALKVSDNVASDEDEPAILILAQHHARELNAPHMVVGAMGRVVAGYATDPAIKNLVDNYELWFVPCCNPDGVDYVWSNNNLWRKNRRNNGNGTFGVDLNRNYPFLWGQCGASTNPGSDTYRGPSPGSEPEVMTMRALVHWLRPEINIDFHNYGRDVLFLYAPCGNVTSQIRGMANHYVDELRGILGYSTRLPSASGEGPQDHWASSGTMALLVESATAFQPSWTASVAEEQRVWPGVEHVLKTWRPSVHGHVRSIYKNQPVHATITYTPNLFNYNEAARSRARDGRFAVWLPVGSTYTLTFSAEGYMPATRAVTVTAYDQNQNLEVEMIPAGAQVASLNVSGTNQIGTTTSLTYSSPGDAGATYWVALSGGTNPGLMIGSRIIPLNPDGLLLASAQPGFLGNNIGTLPGTEQVTATLPIPNVPGLIGMTFYAGGLTLDSEYNFQVKKFSSAVSLTIQ